MIENKISLSRILIYLSGLSLSSIGISISLNSNMGISSWDAVFAGLSEHTFLTIGCWSIIIQSIFALITSILNKKAEFFCIIPIIIRGITLDISKIITSSCFIKYPILLFLCGYLLVALGIGIYVSTGLPRLPIDGLMISLSRFFKITITKSRFIIESLGFATAILLKAPIGIGTIIITFTMAPLISSTQKILKKILLKEGMLNENNTL